MDGRIAFRFVDAEEPLAASVVCGRGDVARALAGRLLELDARVLGRLAGVCGRDLLVVTGPAEELPWVDGVTYLGRHPDAPSLRWPTTQRPDVAPALVERALTARFTAGPLALVPSPWTVVSLSQARPLDTESLRGWLQGRA